MQMRKILALLALVVLVGYNLFAYLPGRLWKMHGMYHIDRAMLEPFHTQAAIDLTPALVLVHIQKQWTEYGGLLALQNAQLSSPFIFSLYRKDNLTAEFQKVFPDRKIFHYYPDEPGIFYPHPR
jgi:hypothetical protein